MYTSSGSSSTRVVAQQYECGTVCNAAQEPARTGKLLCGSASGWQADCARHNSTANPHGLPHCNTPRQEEGPPKYCAIPLIRPPRAVHSYTHAALYAVRILQAGAGTGERYASYCPEVADLKYRKAVQKQLRHNTYRPWIRLSCLMKISRSRD